MSTLSNVETRGDGAESPSDGLDTISTPAAENSQQGVSVRYAPSPNKTWWVIRATYGREKKAYDYITGDGLDTDAYCAMHYVLKKTGDRKKRVLVPLVPSIVFVYCTEKQIYNYVKDTPALGFIRFYYDRTNTKEDETNPPLAVGYPEMMNFIKTTSIDDDNIMLMDERYVHYKSGEKVRVTDGKFAGVEGKVARAAGQQRVIVELQGIALIATAYIPTAWIEKI